MSGVAALLLSAGIYVAPVIDVVYPRIAPGDTISRLDRVDSNFVFGSVQPPDARLWVNGTPVTLHPNGAFITFLPVDWKRSRYVLSARSGRDSVSAIVPFTTKVIVNEVKQSQPAPTVEFPRLVELSGGALRTDPKGTYVMFPASGTRVIASDWAAGYWKLPLTPGRSVWADSRAARLVDKSPPSIEGGVALSVISKLELDSIGGGVTIHIPLDRRLLVHIRDETSPDRIVLELFGAVSHIDRINYPPAGGLRPLEIYWEQPTDAVVSLDIRLSGPLWGYAGHWDEAGYHLRLRPAPAVGRGLDGLRVAIDAGHGGSQDGAIGPTRLLEKEVNLACALELAKRLKKAGAAVLLTRDADTTLGLVERTAQAEAFDADMLISLHHNALPDGVNPFQGSPGGTHHHVTPFGSGVHYYRAQSRLLAETVQAAVVAELELTDEGVFYDDLALVRPTAQPAILLEAAYIMLPEQELLMGQPDYPERLATAVQKGIARFIAERLR